MAGACARVEAGEHPRLFFRKADLPVLKQRAQTPEGQYIVKRLKFLLNGSDGLSLPASLNNSTGHSDRTQTSLKEGKVSASSPRR